MKLCHGGTVWKPKKRGYQGMSMEDMRPKEKHQSDPSVFDMNGIGIHWAEQDLDGVSFGGNSRVTFWPGLMPTKHPGEDGEQAVNVSLKGRAGHGSESHVGISR